MQQYALRISSIILLIKHIVQKYCLATIVLSCSFENSVLIVFFIVNVKFAFLTLDEYEMFVPSYLLVRVPPFSEAPDSLFLTLKNFV